MKKRRRNKKDQRQKRHTIHVLGVGRVQLGASRESQTPFCAYYGPDGEMCSRTSALEVVYLLPSIPPVVYMACPLHYDAVSRMVQQFLDRLENLS